jgi:DNA helicase-2/ATP-dependent DNA helicase PcrA
LLHAATAALASKKGMAATSSSRETCTAVHLPPRARARLQASILLALKPNGKGLTVVGDDAQSIYSFRAATVRNILDFPGHFSPRAEIATLERNYRSTKPILAAANAVMDLAEERFTKNLWSERASAERPRLVSVRDEADQARFVAEKILENREQGILLKTQAVLCCSGPPITALRSKSS